MEDLPKMETILWLIAALTRLQNISAQPVEKLTELTLQSCVMD